MQSQTTCSKTLMFYVRDNQSPGTLGHLCIPLEESCSSVAFFSFLQAEMQKLDSIEVPCAHCGTFGPDVWDPMLQKSRCDDQKPTWSLRYSHVMEQCLQAFGEVTYCYCHLPQFVLELDWNSQTSFHLRCSRYDGALWVGSSAVCHAQQVERIIQWAIDVADLGTDVKCWLSVQSSPHWRSQVWEGGWMEGQ